MKKTLLLLSSLAVLYLGLGNLTAQDQTTIKVYKSPYCGCCGNWVKALRKDGFKLEVVDTNNMLKVKQGAGISQNLASCHTAFVNGYVLEGHVHPQSIKKLLSDEPDIKGLAVPGMPASSVGMDMGDDAYDVLAISKNGKSSIYQSFNR